MLVEFIETWAIGCPSYCAALINKNTVRIKTTEIVCLPGSSAQVYMIKMKMKKEFGNEKN